MEHIKFTDYDRIQDTLLYLDNRITLNFVVTLSSKDMQGGRRSFYYETEYNSKFIGTQLGRGIKRSMNYYFVLDVKDDFGNSIVIHPHDVYFLNLSFEKKVVPWFGSNRVYEIKENRLFVTKKYKPFVFPFNDRQYIAMKPIVLELNDGKYKEGVRFEMNNQNIFADIAIDKFFDLKYTLENTDMYGAACSLLNFVKTQPYGENIYRRVGLGAGAEPNTEPTNNNSSKRNNFLDKLGGGNNA